MIHKQQIVHRVQFTLSVSEIKIQIRFPCKLQIGIKIGKQETNTIQQVQLKGGVATFSEDLRVQAFMSYEQNQRKYLEKKSNLTVYVVSPRGKNVAGICPIDLSSIMNISTQHHTLINQKLERCPDREATISLKIKGFLIQQLIDANVSMISDRSAQYSQPINRLFATNNNSQQKNQNRFNTHTPQVSVIQRKFEREMSQKHKRSLVQQVSTPFHQKLHQNRSDAGSRYTKKQQIDIQSFRSKNKIQELQGQVSTLKRQLIEKKRLQNQVNELGYKVTEMQKVINGNRIQMDSSNKRKKTDTIQYSNKIEQLQKLNLTLQKRLDIKSTFYKQQLQKYNTKLISIQNQKQQFIIEISALKNQNFDLNRNINALKDKEKILNDDKAKLLKRMQDMKKPTIDKSQTSVVGSARDVMYERLRQTISNNQLQKLSLMDQLEKLKNQMLNQGIFRTKYQQELKQKNNLIQQKMFLQTQYNSVVEQTKSQTLRLNKQLIQKTDQIHILNSKIIELNSRTKTDMAKLVDNVDELKSTLDFVRQTQEKGRVEYEDLTYAFKQNQRQLQNSHNKLLQLDNMIRQSRIQKDNLNKNLIKSVEESKRLSHQIQRLKQFINNIEKQYSSQSEAKRNLQFSSKNQIQKLESSNKQLQKQLSLNIQELSLLKIQFDQQYNNFTQQLQRKDKVIKDKQQQIRNTYEQQTNLQMKNVELQSKLGEIKQLNKILEGELLKQRNSGQNLKKVNAVLQQSQQVLKLSLNQTKNNLEQKQIQCEGLIESNRSLEHYLNQVKLEFQGYQQNTNKHINSLLKSLVTRNKTEQLFILPGLSQGLIKLQTDVISKVKNAYDELETVSQRLLNKEMESIGLQQNSNLQTQTLHIQISQLKKHLQSLRQQNSTLTLNIQNLTDTHVNESESLKNRISQLQIMHSESLSSKLKQKSDSYQQSISQLESQRVSEQQILSNKIQQLQQQFSTTQKELYDQYNQVNIMTLKNYELNETIKELEERMINTNSNEGMLIDERGKLINDIMYLEQQLRRLNEMYQILNRNYFISMQKEVVLAQQNEYLRKQFQNNGQNNDSKDLDSSRFQQRENSIIQMHRINSHNRQLNDIIMNLQRRLHEKEVSGIHMQQNIKILGLEVEEKYKIIYELQNEIKQIKSKFKDRSRNNISKTSDNGILSANKIN